MSPKFRLLSLALALSSGVNAADLVGLQRVYSGIETLFPITVAVPDDGTGREFLALQRGQVLILPKDEAATAATMFLDLSGRAMEAKDGKFEEGLNGFAFHPKFKENGLFYLCYTQQMPKRLVVSEMKVSVADGSAADPASERLLLEIPLVNWNHHGGEIAFGPDGFLYIGIGDTSKRNDELHLAQNTASLSGKILRIDVNGRDYHGAYGIPADNPYADGVNALPQIYATGIRNPWGFHFDEKGRFWCADVGQDLWEEINWITNGGNFGWSYREGARQFPLRTDAPPEGSKFIDPIFEYNHGEGLSISGGMVYRGEAMPDLKGAYIYGDFVLGKVWALRVDDSGKVESNTLLYTSPQEPPANGKKKPTVLVKPTGVIENAQKEVLVLDWNGAVYKLTPAK
ncbi:MAG: PQQ-dependent sugar dehydrogenase [Verrucomicrobiaceae bacterium]|nr:PQQ-dependent sugar dehydrogenase [Verrucomicrobiaceae bacterium]